MILELHRFLQAAKEGNITRTAEKIFITQSALTQSIQRLEKVLGTKLFIQKGKQLQLTDDGKAIEIIAVKILSLWEKAKDRDSRIMNEQTVSLGLYDNAALRLGSFIQNTFSRNPFRLELTIEGSTTLFTKLTLGILDAAICVTNVKNMPSKNISLLATFSEDLIPVSSKKFSGTIQTIPFIFYNKHSHTREQTDSDFEKHKIIPLVFAESTSTTFMKELALLGSGVALLPENFVRTELSQGTLIKQKLPLEFKRKYGLYINNESTLTKHHPLIQELMKTLKETT